MKNMAVALFFILSIIGHPVFLHAETASEKGGAVVDCSTGPIPGSPVEVSINGVAFKPSVVKMRKGGGYEVDGKAFEKYTFEFKNENDIFAKLSAEVSFIVQKGKKPDGKTFRQLPDTTTFPNISKVKQPAATEGLPEVQGWELQNRDTGVRIASMFNKQASLRVEVGKRSGKTIAGSIKLCVPPGPDAGNSMSTVTGVFEAVVE